MLRLISSTLAGVAAAFSAACQSPAAMQPAVPASLSGQVVDPSGAAVQAQLQIGEQTIVTSMDGRFEVSPDADLVYRIEFSADGYYPMRQTFSHAELHANGDLGEIVLVAQKPGRTLFLFGGDAMIGRRFYTPFEGEPVLVRETSVLEDSKQLLREMKPYITRADYASINLETPIFNTPPGAAAPKSVTFYSKPETLAALTWAGVDYVALGNNHTYDFLEPGLDITMQHLAQSDLDHSGAGKTETPALQPHRERRGDTAYDFLSYVGWPAGTPSQSADASKGGAALGTADNLLSTTRASIDSGGVPILQFHGGLEYVEEPTLAMETKLKRAIDAGAGLVVAHHPHVPQGLELYDGKLMAWSLGNFLFDQYFYSAQAASILYVWMDDGEFYHAETVPVYIKGYHPTPALGPMRNKINRRIHDLSERRGTHLRRSGGHLIVTQANTRPETPLVFDQAVQCQDGRSRVGNDLLARGDFDNYALFDAPDRSWLDLAPALAVRPIDADGWNHALFAVIDAGETVTTGMRKFQRVIKKGTPMTLQADFSASEAVEIAAFVQVRADGQGLSEALENGRRVEIGRVAMAAGETRSLSFDFDTPRTRTRSLRVLIELTAQDAATEVAIDDLELIEWQTPFRSDAGDCRSDVTE